MSVICSLNFQIGKKKHEEWMWTPLVLRGIKEMFNAYKNALSYFSYWVVQYGHWLVSPRVPQQDESRPGFKPNLWAACCRIILNAWNKLVLNKQSVTATISAGKRRSCRYIFFLHKFTSFCLPQKLLLITWSCKPNWELGALRPTLQKTRRFRFHV